MSHYSIRPVGFPESDHARLEAILTIASGRLRENWRWITEGVADIYLVAVESPLEWVKVLSILPRERILACILPNLEIDARWQIRREPAQLPSFHELIRILNAVGSELALGVLPMAPIPEASEPPRPASSDMEAGEVSGSYDSGKHLIGIIRESLADSIPRRLTCGDGGGVILIEPEQGLYFVSGDNILLLPLLTVPRNQIQVEKLSSEQLLREISAMGCQGLALKDLIFISALLGSQGRLWKGCRFDEPVRLKQWPNFKCLPQYMEYTGLMGFMSGNTADVKTIAARTGVPEDKVINFHNACAALDLLDRGGEISIREKPLYPEIRDLYGKIAQRLQSEA